MKNMGQGTHSTKMSADKSAEITLNVPKFICPNCLLKPKSLEFGEKMLHWAFVVRAAHTRAQASYQATKDGRVMGAQVCQCQNGAQKSQNERIVAYRRGRSERV